MEAVSSRTIADVARAACALPSRTHADSIATNANAARERRVERAPCSLLPAPCSLVILVPLFAECLSRDLANLRVLVLQHPHQRLHRLDPTNV